MAKDELSNAIAAFRHFDRFYTKQIGALNEGLLESPFTLTEARIIYELANRDSDRVQVAYAPLLALTARDSNHGAPSASVS